MTATDHARPTTRLPVILFAGLLIVLAAIAAAVGYPWVRAPSSLAEASIDIPRTGPDDIRAAHDGLGEADGVIPDGTTVFDDKVAGIANLDPDLRKALRRAATDGAHDGVEVFIDSGWRSPAYQDQLLRAAVSKYGSMEEAARWVATPTTSAHVSGKAVDIGPVEATAWLSEHGAEYGLCQVYRNEPWHYELRPGAVDHGCPRMYADPTHDPRTRG